GTLARLGVITHDYHPLALAGQIGVVSTARLGRLYAQIAPTFVLGLTARRNGNRDRLQIPLFAGGPPPRHVELHLRSGVEGALATFRDTYAIPVGAGFSV